MQLESNGKLVVLFIWQKEGTMKRDRWTQLLSI